jgi:hypothetical protein
MPILLKALAPVLNIVIVMPENALSPKCLVEALQLALSLWVSIASLYMFRSAGPHIGGELAEIRTACPKRAAMIG